MLVVVCGLPGVGKTTVAKQVADRVDGRVLRTDVIRKELRPEPRYTGEETRTVYRELFERAEETLAGGESVVLDGTFRARADRNRAAAVADRLDAAFELVRVECAEPVVEARIESRTGDESDADFAVHAMVREAFEPVSMDHVVVDNSEDLERTRRQVATHFP